jgi:hypothetical protein
MQRAIVRLAVPARAQAWSRPTSRACRPWRTRWRQAREVDPSAKPRMISPSACGNTRDPAGASASLGRTAPRPGPSTVTSDARSEKDCESHIRCLLSTSSSSSHHPTATWPLRNCLRWQRAMAGRCDGGRLSWRRSGARRLTGCLDPRLHPEIRSAQGNSQAAEDLEIANGDAVASGCFDCR